MWLFSFFFFFFFFFFFHVWKGWKIYRPVTGVSFCDVAPFSSHSTPPYFLPLNLYSIQPTNPFHTPSNPTQQRPILPTIPLHTQTPLHLSQPTITLPYPHLPTQNHANLTTQHPPSLHPSLPYPPHPRHTPTLTQALPTHHIRPPPHNSHSTPALSHHTPAESFTTLSDLSHPISFHHTPTFPLPQYSYYIPSLSFFSHPTIALPHILIPPHIPPPPNRCNCNPTYPHATLPIPFHPFSTQLTSKRAAVPYGTSLTWAYTCWFGSKYAVQYQVCGCSSVWRAVWFEYSICSSIWSLDLQYVLQSVLVLQYAWHMSVSVRFASTVLVSWIEASTADVIHVLFVHPVYCAK